MNCLLHVVPTSLSPNLTTVISHLSSKQGIQFMCVLTNVKGNRSFSIYGTKKQQPSLVVCRRVLIKFKPFFMTHYFVFVSDDKMIFLFATDHNSRLSTERIIINYLNKQTVRLTMLLRSSCQRFWAFYSDEHPRWSDLYLCILINPWE